MWNEDRENGYEDKGYVEHEEIVDGELTEEEDRPAEAGRTGAIVSLVLGVLTILSLITVVPPIVFGILAIVFGVKAKKGNYGGMAIAGICLGTVGLVLLSIVMAVAIKSILSAGDVKNMMNPHVSGVPGKQDTMIIENTTEDYEEGNAVFHVNGYELVYSDKLWTETKGEKDVVLVYNLDGTTLQIAGQSTLLGRDISTADGRNDLFAEFLEMYKRYQVESDGYSVNGRTETFDELNENCYYASYGIYNQDDELEICTYVLAWPEQDSVLSFIVNTENLTRHNPDIPVMPILKSVQKANEENIAPMDIIEGRVQVTEDTIQVLGDSSPSLEFVMIDQGIEYTDNGAKKVVGSMIVPSILDFTTSAEEREKAPVEMVEVRYTDVEDVWAVIDEYGRLLSESYDWDVTHTPTEYPNMGDDYRFCELIKSISEDEYAYVACVYSQEAKEIQYMTGYVGGAISSNGIGPINLERVAEG